METFKLQYLNGVDWVSGKHETYTFYFDRPCGWFSRWSIATNHLRCTVCEIWRVTGRKKTFFLPPTPSSPKIRQLSFAFLDIQSINQSFISHNNM